MIGIKVNLPSIRFSSVFVRFLCFCFSVKKYALFHLHFYKSISTLLYFLANKPRPVFNSENEGFCILPPNKLNQKISLTTGTFYYYFATKFVRYALHLLHTKACPL